MNPILATIAPYGKHSFTVPETIFGIIGAIAVGLTILYYLIIFGLRLMLWVMEIDSRIAKSETWNKIFNFFLG